jgi:hypothetical protein
MRPSLDHDQESLPGEEDLAHFMQALNRVSPDYRRVLGLLIPRLAALEERGDMVGALELIRDIQAIVTAADRPEH